MPLSLSRRPSSPHWYIRGTVAGKRHSVCTGTASEEIARELLVAMEHRLYREAIYGADVVKTFAEAAEAYAEWGGERRFLPKVVSAIGNIKLAEISQDTIDAAATRTFPAVAPSTLNRQFYGPVSAVMTYASSKGWCQQKALRRPRQAPLRAPRWLQHHEAERLLTACNDALRPIVLFMLYSGARCGEALYLDWSQVDLDRSHVSFLNTKNGHSRGVPLHSRIVTCLRELPHRDGAVFRTPSGRPYTPPHKGVELDTSAGTRIKGAFRSAVTKAGVAPFTPHGCRHTWASWHYLANRDLLTLQKLGGWRSMAMVQRYTHVNVEDHRDSIERI